MRFGLSEGYSSNQKLSEHSRDDVRVRRPCQATDPFCLATIKHYRSLIPMGQEHRKPIFNLTSADGAIGSHAAAVADAKKDFKQLAVKIAAQMGMEI